MNEMNEQLMTSLHTTYRTLRRRSATETLGSAPVMPKRGDLMDRRKLAQMKEQFALLQRETIVRELAAIINSRSGKTETEIHLVSEKHLMSYLSGDPESINEALLKLEREGFIKRTRRKPGSRDYDLSFTEKGWQYAAELKEIKDRQNEEFLKPLTAEEKATLIHLLKKINVAEELGLD